MADSSLDDFFAKKDKSKKKSKSKMTPGDVLAAKEEGPKKVKKKKDTEMPGGLGLSTSEETAAKKQAEDDDWVDYEVKKEVDYSGLRIQTLQIREEEDRDTAESDGDGEGGEGEDGQVSSTGPWNSAVAAPVPAPAPVSAPPPSEPPEKKEDTGPKKYVPPAQRQAALNPVSANPISRRANKKAPNIQSEEDFPTLGGGMHSSPGSVWGGKRYEDSKAADIESNPGQRRGGNLALENKFSVLQD